MSRYIEAEKILPYISRLLGAMPLAVLKMAETDGVDIVRCKECKWRDQFGCALEIVDKSDRPNDDDYCSFGERKEGE